MDKVLRNQAKTLFEIDDKSRDILAFIAEHGPSTTYDMESRGQGLTRQSVLRRLSGEKNLISLLEYNYLYLQRVEDFPKTGGKKKFYGLTLKGGVAALTKTPFGSIYLFKDFSAKVQQLGASITLIESPKKFLMAELALILQFHVENGLSLTRLRSDGYFSIFRHYVKELWKPPITQYSGLLRGIRAEAAKWSLVVSRLIDTLEPPLNRKLFYIIFDWPYYARFIQDTVTFERWMGGEMLPGNPLMINHAVYEDENKYAFDEAEKILGRAP